MNDASCKLPYYFSDETDLRRGTNFWSEETLEQMTSAGVASQPSICFNKYADLSNNTKPYRYMIPLVRMSEIYLMAAECSDDLTEAIGYINQVRVNRNCVNLELQPGDTEETIRQYICLLYTSQHHLPLSKSIIQTGKYVYKDRKILYGIRSGYPDDICRKH